MVDSLAFHHIILVLSSGGRGEVKKSPCIVNGPMIIQDFCNLTNWGAIENGQEQAVEFYQAWRAQVKNLNSAIILVVGDTQSDSIQYLNFAKKWFIQYSIQYCYTQDSIQNIIQLKKNSADSIQKIIQFNSQGLFDTGRIGKVPENCPK